MKIMGVDPGTLNMGIGMITVQNKQLEPIFFTTIRVSAKKKLHERLFFLYQEVEKIIGEYRPDVLALEDVYFGMSFKSAIRIGEARCAVILAATKFGVPVEEYPPARVKSAVSGFGRAAKVQVQHMVQQVLRLKEMPPPDTADALAIAICHSNRVR